MNRRLKALLPVIVLMVSGGATLVLATRHPSLESKPAAAPPPAVQVMTVHPARVRVNVHSQGVLTPRNEIDLVAEVAGKIVRLHPRLAAGGRFETGEVLLAVDDRAYRLAIVKGEARLAEARRMLAQEEAAALQAGREWQVLGEGQPTPFALHQPQLAEARANLKAAEADLAEARLRLAHCELRAPFAGRVREKFIGLGQSVTAGDRLARIYAADVAELRLPVTTEQLALLDLPADRPGKARPSAGPAVTLSTGSGHDALHRKARLVRREGIVDPATGMEHLVAELDDPFGWQTGEKAVSAGLFVQAEIQGRELDGIFVLPQGALDASQNALLVTGDDRLSIRPVTVLRSEPERILVSGGLADGERVVLSGVEVPVAGMAVRVEPDAGAISDDSRRASR